MEGMGLLRVGVGVMTALLKKMHIEAWRLDERNGSLSRRRVNTNKAHMPIDYDHQHTFKTSCTAWIQYADLVIVEAVHSEADIATIASIVGEKRA